MAYVMKRRKRQLRSDFILTLNSLWDNAKHFHWTQTRLLEEQTTAIWTHPDFKRLAQYDKSYIHGYSEALHRIAARDMEHGSWVRMPDGETEFFGVESRLGKSSTQLEAEFPSIRDTGLGFHRYLCEHTVSSGIYWKNPTWPGRFVFFTSKEGSNNAS